MTLQSDFRAKMLEVRNSSLNQADTTTHTTENWNDRIVTDSVKGKPFNVAKICANVVAGVLIAGFFVLIGLASYGTIPMFALLIGGVVAYVGTLPAVALFVRERIFKADEEYGSGVAYYEAYEDTQIEFKEDEDSMGQIWS